MLTSNFLHVLLSPRLFQRYILSFLPDGCFAGQVKQCLEPVLSNLLFILHIQVTTLHCCAPQYLKVKGAAVGTDTSGIKAQMKNLTQRGKDEFCPRSLLFLPQACLFILPNLGEQMIQPDASQTQQLLQPIQVVTAIASQMSVTILLNVCSTPPISHKLVAVRVVSL